MINGIWHLACNIKGEDFDGCTEREMDEEVIIPLEAKTEEEAGREAMVIAKNIYHHLPNDVNERASKMDECSCTNFNLLYVCKPIPLNMV